MDEPFSALDIRTRDELFEFVLSLWEETRKTIVLVAHSRDEPAILADRVLVLGLPGGCVTADLTNAFPRPRRLADPSVNAFRQDLLSRIHAIEPRTES